MNVNGRGKWCLILLLVGLTGAPWALADEGDRTSWATEAIEWVLAVFDEGNPDVESTDSDEIGPHLEPTG